MAAILWKVYEASLHSRRRYLTVWARRILDLRMCLGWSVRQFAHISRIDLKTIRLVENGKAQGKGKYYPRLVTIKKIRLLEAAYRLELRRFHGDRRAYNRLAPKDSDRGYFNPPIGPPADPAYIEALGGLARFAVLRRRRHLWDSVKQRASTYFRTDTFPAITTAEENLNYYRDREEQRRRSASE